MYSWVVYHHYLWSLESIWSFLCVSTVPCCVSFFIVSTQTINLNVWNFWQTLFECQGRGGDEIFFSGNYRKIGAFHRLPINMRKNICPIICKKFNIFDQLSMTFENSAFTFILPLQIFEKLLNPPLGPLSVALARLSVVFFLLIHRNIHRILR